MTRKNEFVFELKLVKTSIVDEVQISILIMYFLIFW